MRSPSVLSCPFSEVCVCVCACFSARPTVAFHNVDSKTVGVLDRVGVARDETITLLFSLSGTFPLARPPSTSPPFVLLCPSRSWGYAGRICSRRLKRRGDVVSSRCRSHRGRWHARASIPGHVCLFRQYSAFVLFGSSVSTCFLFDVPGPAASLRLLRLARRTQIVVIVRCPPLVSLSCPSMRVCHQCILTPEWERSCAIIFPEPAQIDKYA